MLAALILIGRVLIAPDAGSSLFSKARQLEAAGQISLALRHYALVSTRHPESSLAPQALLKQGDLLSVRGRSNKNTDDLRNAMTAYAKLAENYPRNKLSNAALFDAGEIAAQDLGDSASARRFYQLIMERNSDRSDQTALATTKLGRLALAEGDGKTALATVAERARQLAQRCRRRAPKRSFIWACFTKPSSKTATKRSAPTMRR